MITRIFSFAVLLILWCLVKEHVCQEQKDIGFILPGNVIPTHYNLSWTITDDCLDKEEFNFDKTFHGTALITMKAIKQDVKVIEMNSKNLTFFDVTLSFENGSNQTNLKPVFYEREEKVLFNLPFELPMSKSMRLTIVFKGKMSRTRGMFIHNQMVPEGDKSFRRDLIGTILEPAYARTVYPCFDEPEYKATFTVSMDVSQCALDKGYLGFANTPVENIEYRKGRAIIHFEKSNVVMSTYLMTIAFAPFVSTPNQQFNSSYPDASQSEWKDFKTWGTKVFVNSKIGRLVQKAGVRLMEIFTNDLQMGYPLKKMDQLNIILSGYLAGMENWGVVFYQFYLSEYGNVQLVAHELAHQWFGDLVTCHWWSDIWLNEGFASYFANYGTYKFGLEYPGWEIWYPLISAAKELASSLNGDVLNSRPLTQMVEDPREYHDLFDFIAYKKGGAVLRMWNNVLGEKAFLKGVHKYLDDRKLNVSTPKHLLKAFDSVVDLSSSEFGEARPSMYFEKWRTQRGFPLVTVMKSEANESEYIVRQRIFKASRNQPSTRWTIPISYSTNSSIDFDKTHAMLWFRDDEDSVVIKLPNPVEWIIVNNKFTGYYRVNYDRKNWEALLSLMINITTFKNIPVENRIQILSDLSAIVSENFTSVNYDLFMNMTLYLKHETDYYPWKSALDNVLSFMDTMMSKSTTYYELFKEYAKDLLQEMYFRLSFNRRHFSSYSDKRLRSEIIKWACRINYSECIEDSENFLKSYIRRGNIYDESYEEYELYEVAYCTSIRNTNNDWDTLWRKYLSAANFVDKKVILHGISCSNDENILKRLLRKSVDITEDFSGKERQTILEMVMESDPRNVEMAFDFFVEHHKHINEMYHESIGKLLIRFAEKLATDRELNKMKHFVDALKKDGEISMEDMEQALAITESNNHWMREKSDDVILWLFNRYGRKCINI